MLLLTLREVSEWQDVCVVWCCTLRVCRFGNWLDVMFIYHLCRKDESVKTSQTMPMPRKSPKGWRASTASLKLLIRWQPQQRPTWNWKISQGRWHFFSLSRWVSSGKILHSMCDVGSNSIWNWRNSTGEKQRYVRCGTAIRTSTPLRGPLHHLACLQLPLSPVRNFVLGLENKQQPWAWNCYSIWLDTVFKPGNKYLKTMKMNNQICLNDIVWQCLT